MRVSLPSPALPLGLVLGAALAFAWPDPAAEGAARIAELEREIERAQTRNELRTAFLAGAATEHPEYPADPVVWDRPWRAPPGEHPRHTPDAVRRAVTDVVGDPDDVLAVTCDPYPCRALVVGEPGLVVSGMEAAGYDVVAGGDTLELQIPSRSWDIVKLRYVGVLLPVGAPPEEGAYGSQLLQAMFATERPALDVAVRRALDEAWAERLSAAGEAYPPELVEALK